MTPSSHGSTRVTNRGHSLHIMHQFSSNIGGRSLLKNCNTLEGVAESKEAESGGTSRKVEKQIVDHMGQKRAQYTGNTL